MWQWRMEGSQVSTSSLVSGGEAMLVAEIIKLGLREGLEDLPSPKGPLLPGFPFKILGFYFPPPVPLPVCPSAGLRASAEWSSRGFFNAFNVSICSRFGLLPGSKHRAHSPAAWRITRCGHRMPEISCMDLVLPRWQVLFLRFPPSPRTLRLLWILHLSVRQTEPCGLG